MASVDGHSRQVWLRPSAVGKVLLAKMLLAKVVKMLFAKVAKILFAKVAKMLLAKAAKMLLAKVPKMLFAKVTKMLSAKVAKMLSAKVAKVAKMLSAKAAKMLRRLLLFANLSSKSALLPATKHVPIVPPPPILQTTNMNHLRAPSSNMPPVRW